MEDSDSWFKLSDIRPIYQAAGTDVHFDGGDFGGGVGGEVSTSVSQGEAAEHLRFVGSSGGRDLPRSGGERLDGILGRDRPAHQQCANLSAG